MDTIRITKIFHFEMAHVLNGYDGPCSNVHGHSYQLHVTVMGKPIMDAKHPKNGMVMDFGDLKKIINSLIVNPLDHAFVLNANMPDDFVALTKKNFEKVVVVDYQPTSEMMLADFARKMQSALPEGIKLFSMRLCETASSFAEWFAEDN
jgi:6-pyruvoyl-tetrahydropterin synthase